ncbi:hypothetical protein ES703_75367 [subsurface metagenome]
MNEHAKPRLTPPGHPLVLLLLGFFNQVHHFTPYHYYFEGIVGFSPLHILAPKGKGFYIGSTLIPSSPTSSTSR